MGKYIIELEDSQSVYKTIIANGYPMLQVIVPAPYTEPDLDAIRNEAYEKGVQDTKQHWVDAPRSCAYKLGYENGLNDLWEAMQKAIKMYCEIDNEVYLRVFYDVKCDWGESVLQALFKNTPQHLIDSIREYEQRQEEQIQVGDEVEAAFGKATVTETTEKHVYYFYADGSYGFDEKEHVSKTGRHFHEIAEVLQKMKESDNG